MVRCCSTYQVRNSSCSLRDSVFSRDEQHVLHHLHGDRRRAEAEVAALQVLLQRRAELRRDEAVVLEEAVVLGGHDRVHEVRRDLGRTARSRGSPGPTTKVIHLPRLDLAPSARSVAEQPIGVDRVAAPRRLAALDADLAAEIDRPRRDRRGRSPRCRSVEKLPVSLKPCRFGVSSRAAPAAPIWQGSGCTFSVAAKRGLRPEVLHVGGEGRVQVAEVDRRLAQRAARAP